MSIPGIVDLIKPFKNLLLMFFGNPRAEILDADNDPFLVFGKTNEYLLCLWRVLDRVRKKIDQNLSDALSISIHLGLCLSFKKQVPAWSYFLYHSHDLFHQVIYVKGFFVIAQFAGLYTRNIQ